MSQKYVLNANSPERSQVLANTHAFLDRLADTKSWCVEIKRHRKQRSLNQNNALFGCAYPVLCEATGYDPDELHEAMCRKFFGTADRVVMGEVLPRPVRTTTRNEQGERDVIDTATMSKFYDMVQRVGAEIDVTVPDPDPMYGLRNRWAA